MKVYRELFEAIEEKSDREVLGFICSIDVSQYLIPFKEAEPFFESPLSLAVSHGRATLAKILVEMGAEINAKNTDGYTALDRVPVDCPELFELIQSYGAISGWDAK